jgi:hypothetical protein
MSSPTGVLPITESALAPNGLGLDSLSEKQSGSPGSPVLFFAVLAEDML